MVQEEKVEDLAMSNKRRFEDTVRIPALVEEIRAAKSMVDPDVAAKRAKLLEVEINSLTPDMEARFEFFMRSHFDSRVVKRVLQKEIDCATTDLNHSMHPGQEPIAVTTGTTQRKQAEDGSGRPAGPAVTDDMSIVVCGLAKLYVGELVSIATEVMMERLSARSSEDTGAMPPDMNSFGLLEAAEEVDTVYDVSAFTFVSTLGANYTNGVLSLTARDIEEAARRMGDKNMHGKPAAMPHALLSNLAPVNYRNSTNSLLMPGGSALGGIGVNYGELASEEEVEEVEGKEEKAEKKVEEEAPKPSSGSKKSRGERKKKKLQEEEEEDEEDAPRGGRGGKGAKGGKKATEADKEKDKEDEDGQPMEEEEEKGEEEEEGEGEEEQIEAPPAVTTLREVQGDIVASERAFDTLDEENLQFLVRHYNEGVHARESELEDLLKKYVRSQEDVINRREKAEAEQKAVALAQAQSAALAAAATAESKSAASALAALNR